MQDVCKECVYLLELSCYKHDNPKNIPVTCFLGVIMVSIFNGIKLQKV